MIGKPCYDSKMRLQFLENGTEYQNGKPKMTKPDDRG